jgi:hypothetical protein
MLTSGLTTSAKMLLLELLATEQFKVALYSVDAYISPSTDFYTSLGEVVGKGYKAGGLPLKNPKVWNDNGVACLTWDSPVIPVSTISANGFMIYCPSRGNKCIFVGDWSGTYSSTEGPFTITIADDQLCIE